MLAAQTRTKLRALLHEVLNQEDAVLDQMIAETLSERPIDHAGYYPENDPLTGTELREALGDDSADTLMRTPAARLILLDAGTSAAVLAYDGQSVTLDEHSVPLAQILTRKVFYDSAELLAATEQPAAADLLALLYVEGVLQWHPHLLEH
jgi:50S ribosomal protein L16 3-hydroxylase